MEKIFSNNVRVSFLKSFTHLKDAEEYQDLALKVLEQEYPEMMVQENRLIQTNGQWRVGVLAVPRQMELDLNE